MNPAPAHEQAIVPLSEIEAQKVLVEVYKVYVLSADQVSARRQAANAFFLTLNTLVLGATGYLIAREQIVQIGFATLGIVLSSIWFMLIISFRNLNSAKFNVIQQLESTLPFRPFAAEWKLLARRYVGAARLEMCLPWLFGAAYTGLLLSFLGVIPKAIALAFFS